MGSQDTTGTAVSGETALSFAYLVIIGYDGAYPEYYSCYSYSFIAKVAMHLHNEG